jgi:hypothetical protein
MTTQNTPTSEEQQQQELRKKFRELLEASLADIDRAYEEQQHIQEELLIQGYPEPSRFSYCTMSPFSGERCTTCGHPTSSCTCDTQKSANI